jgi:hypothetical protein
MIQRFNIGELVHNIKTDEVGKITELLLDTSRSPQYKFSLADAKHAVWDESDLIPSTHTASAS